MLVHRLSLLAGLTLLAPAALLADEPAKPPADKPADQPATPDPFAGVEFKPGPVDGKLGDLAVVKVPEGMLFVGGRENLNKFITATQNLGSGDEVGVVLPTAEGESWWLLFEFEKVGYVKDDEKDSLDGDALLKSITEGTASGNEERKKRGFPELSVVGWHTPPKYNQGTHNLEWAAKLKSVDGETLNYNVRILGRRGVMSATLIASPAQIEAALPRLRTLLGGYSFLPEQTYAAYKDGDKVAEYGLAALVTGGAIAVAAKSGLLGKLWKLIVAAAVGLGAGVKKLFGKKKPAQDPTV